ncbi:putative mycorrhiza-upregulated peptidase C14 [Rhizoctonia solani 123E]|uniref:Putative mycorrhiza-upregulated peptidase C14 n=1 Tax=Rhizoctonia solani 123E TaxID=1423351 RepID=A0A074RIN1_9AGAM|nr:putative mycorrhiza-upregulated peptidase C14 [Rhizoctonia solani 123E]
MTTLDANRIVQKLCEKVEGASAQATPSHETTTEPTGVDSFIGINSYKGNYHLGSEQVLDIYVTQDFVDAAEPSEVWARAFSGEEGQLIMRPVEEDLATVVLSVNAQKQATFTLNYPPSVEYGIQMLPVPCYSPISPSAQHVLPILTALFHWNWHLHRVPKPRPFQQSIDLEFHKLQPTDEYDDEGVPVLVPIGENLGLGGGVDVIVSDEDYYGLRVVNRSTQDLYAYLLFFSATSLDITYRHLPMLGSSTSNPNLTKDVPLTIGYGSGGQYPLMFAIDEPLNFDVTVFKLFVSTIPTDLQSLEQQNPFDGRRKVSGCIVKNPFEEKSIWDAFTITIVQRRYPMGEEPTDA